MYQQCSCIIYGSTIKIQFGMFVKYKANISIISSKVTCSCHLLQQVPDNCFTVTILYILLIIFGFSSWFIHCVFTRFYDSCFFFFMCYQYLLTRHFCSIFTVLANTVSYLLYILFYFSNQIFQRVVSHCSYINLEKPPKKLVLLQE